MPFSLTPYTAQATGNKSQAAWKCFTSSALQLKQLTDFILYYSTTWFCNYFETFMAIGQ